MENCLDLAALRFLPRWARLVTLTFVNLRCLELYEIEIGRWLSTAQWSCNFFHIWQNSKSYCVLGFHTIPIGIKENKHSAHVGVPNKRKIQNFVKSTPTWLPWCQYIPATHFHVVFNLISNLWLANKLLKIYFFSQILFAHQALKFLLWIQTWHYQVFIASILYWGRR